MKALGRSLRRLASIGLVARFLDWYPVRRVVATVLRSATVRSRGRFVVRELTGRRGTFDYRLRGSGRCVFIRHGTADIVTLDEVFYTRSYALPQEVATSLDSLDRAPRVLDLGANIGLFGLFIRERHPDAPITAIEADPDNAMVLRRCIAANETAERWKVVEAVAATHDGTVSFVPGAYSLSHVAGPDETGVPLPAVDVFRYLADMDLLKVDIEGGEWEILADPRFAETPLRAIVLEYHAFSCPETNPREAAAAALAAAGFVVEAKAADDYGVAWGWRPPERQRREPAASSRSTGTPPTTG
jgi:FkbM family methyltransferase